MNLGKVFQEIALKHPRRFPRSRFIIHFAVKWGKVNKLTFSFYRFLPVVVEWISHKDTKTLRIAEIPGLHLSVFVPSWQSSLVDSRRMKEN